MSAAKDHQPVLLSADPQLLAAPCILLRAHLDQSGKDLSSCLIIETNDYCLRVNLPVTRKGTLLELVDLPSGVQRLLLESPQEEERYILNNLTITPVGSCERYGRMWYRVLSAFGKLPGRKRRRVGLMWFTPVVDLAQAYKLVSSFRAYIPRTDYLDWIEQFDTVFDEDDSAMRRLAAGLEHEASNLRVVLDARSADSFNSLNQTLGSVAALVTPSLQQLVLVQDQVQAELIQPFLPPAMLLVLESQWQELHEQEDHTPDWTLLVPVGCCLAPGAVLWLLAEIRRHPGAQLIYSDHDHLDSKARRCHPQFKPDWNLEFARTSGYPGQVLALRTKLLAGQAKLNPDLSPYRLMLRVAALSEPNIRHIPAVLWHQLGGQPEKNMFPPHLEEHLSAMGVAASVFRMPSGHLRVAYALPKKTPKVSIVIPTRNMPGYLKRCVESVLQKTTYPDFEVFIVDNQSDDPDALTFMQHISSDPRVRLLHYNYPFNFSAINNFAVNQVTGEYVCLLNNDTEVITPDWLDEMVSHLAQPGVGAVGAKLYFSDGRIQHAGVTVGPGGCADHLHNYLDGDAPGYMDRAVLAQDLSAVTGACLLTSRTLYQQSGGLDEKNLPVAFNDVDYCLRVREMGFRVVFTPYAELYHHESVSRGKDDHPEKQARAKREVAYMRKRWKVVMAHDPFYNLNLSYHCTDFSLSPAPLVTKPWEN